MELPLAVFKALQSCSAKDGSCRCMHYLRGRQHHAAAPPHGCSIVKLQRLCHGRGLIGLLLLLGLGDVLLQEVGLDVLQNKNPDLRTPWHGERIDKIAQKLASLSWQGTAD